MDILLQSDGQLYPPRHAEPSKPKPKPPPPKKEPPAPVTPSKPTAPPAAIPWEELLLAGIAFLVLKSNEKPDIPLLLALAYVLFDNNFSLQNLF